MGLFRNDWLLKTLASSIDQFTGRVAIWCHPWEGAEMEEAGLAGESRSLGHAFEDSCLTLSSWVSVPGCQARALDSTTFLLPWPSASFQTQAIGYPDGGLNPLKLWMRKGNVLLGISHVTGSVNPLTEQTWEDCNLNSSNSFNTVTRYLIYGLFHVL